ncbi:MAG: excinuclease UvrABC helicase subunit UvrB [Bacillariaceae sp.]|jgi:excinuclease UvrABC helicase subunit UvrB
MCIAPKKREGEADRILKRVAQDLALLRETGTCPGIEKL